MKQIIPLIALCALLSACNSGSGSSAAADDETTPGGLNFPVSAAQGLAPPSDGALPADLMPPS